MILQLRLANQATEKWRKNEGDIIAVMPDGSKGGVLGRKQYLHVRVDFGNLIKSRKEAHFLEASHRADGTFFLTFQNDEFGKIIPDSRPAILAKRRYTISFSTLDNLAKAQKINVNWKRVRDENDFYQPFTEIVFNWQDLLIYDKYEDTTLNALNMGEIINSGK